MGTDRDLYARLDELGITVTITKHPAVHTVDESKRLRGALDGALVKNLLLRNKRNALWLVCALEETSLDLKALAARLESGRLSFAKADELQMVLGITPGTVSPLAVINDSERCVRVVLEKQVLAQECLNFHPLRNDVTVTMATADFLRFLEAAGHSPIRFDAAS